MGEVDALERLLVLVLEATAFGEILHRFLVLRFFMLFNRLLILENFVDAESTIVILIFEYIIPDTSSLES